jgi:hypothetical protein
MVNSIPLAPKNAEDIRSGEAKSVTLEAPKVRVGGEPSMAKTGTESALYYLEAALSGAGEGSVWAFDALINRAIDLGVMTGAIDPNIDRDLLSRTFYSRNYEKQAKTGLPEATGLGNYGEGEYVGFQEPAARITQAAGSAASAAVPVLGVAARSKQVLEAGRTLTPTQLALTSRETALNAGEGTLKNAGRELATGLAQQFAKNPKGMFATEAAIGAGAGAITEAAEVAMPGSGAYVAVAPAAVPLAIQGIGKAIKTVFNMSPSGRALTWASQQPETQQLAAEARYRVKDALGSMLPGREGKAISKTQAKILEEATRPDAMAEAEKAAEIQRRIKEITDMELRLSPAEVTMSPSLGYEQARIESRMQGKVLADNIQRKKENLEKLLKFRNKIFDEGESTPSMIIDNATGRIQAIQTKTGKQLTDVNNTLTGMADVQTGVLPQFEPGAAVEKGMSIRQQLKRMRDSAEETANRMARKLKIDTANPIGDATVIQQQVRDDLKLANEDISFEFMHPVVKKFLNFEFNAKGNAGKMSFQDWKNFRSMVGQARFEANDVDSRHLAILQQNLDDLMFKGRRTADNFREFGQWYMHNVVLPFEDAAVIKVTKLGPGSRPGKDIYNYVTPPEAVAKSFLKDSSTATTYMKLFGGDAEKMGVIRDTVMDEVARYAVKDGRIDPTKLQNYVTKNREVLDKLFVPGKEGEEFKNLYTQLTDTKQATEKLLNRERVLRSRENVVSKYRLNQIFTKNAGMPDNLTLDQTMDMAFKDPKVMYQLSRSVRDDPLARKAFNRAVVDRIITPEDSATADAFGKFLGKNENLLRSAMGDEHFDDLTVLNEAYRRVLATGLSNGRGVEKDDFVKSISGYTGVTPEGWSARVIANVEGRASPRTTFVWMAGQAIRANQSAALDRAFEQSIFDPDFAKKLTERTTGVGEITMPQARRLAEKFLYYGIQDPSVPQPTESFTIDVPGGGLPMAPPAEPEPPPPPVPTPGQQGALQPRPAPATMPMQNMASAMPPPSAPPADKGIAGTRFAAMFPGDTLGAMAASGGIASLRG